MTNSGINAKVFWNNVRRLREDLDKSQIETANYAGLNPSYYSNLEKGMQKSVNPKVAKLVAEFLGTTVEELSKGKPPAVPLFWANVIQKRYIENVSQVEMAKALNITTTAYTYRENTMPKKVKNIDAEAMARVLHTTVADLMGRKEMIFNDLSEEAKDFLATKAGREKLEELVRSQE